MSYCINRAVSISPFDPSVDTFSPYMDTSIISYGFDTFSGGAKKTRLGNSGWDRDITITTTSSSNTGKAERWESFADGVDKLPAVRIRGQVYVNNFTKSSGYGCYVELRFHYVNKSLGDNRQCAKRYWRDMMIILWCRRLYGGRGRSVSARQIRRGRRRGSTWRRCIRSPARP